MARLTEQFRASDVTFWGVFALSAWGIAVLGAGASALLPPGLLSGLHSPMIQTTNLGQLQAQIADLEARDTALKADNAMLLNRAALAEQQATDITKRLGALEVTMPKVIEAVNTPPAVDRSAITGSTGTTTPTTQPADGGTVSYTVTPLVAVPAATGDVTMQTMPSALQQAVPDSNAYGVALGPPILTTEATGAWKSVNEEAGTLLLGLNPLLGTIEGAPGRRLVAGPLPTEADARALCGGFAKLGIACSSVSFVGEPLPG